MWLIKPQHRHLHTCCCSAHTVHIPTLTSLSSRGANVPDAEPALLLLFMYRQNLHARNQRWLRTGAATAAQHPTSPSATMCAAQLLLPLHLMPACLHASNASKIGHPLSRYPCQCQALPAGPARQQAALPMAPHASLDDASRHAHDAGALGVRLEVIVAAGGRGHSGHVGRSVCRVPGCLCWWIHAVGAASCATFCSTACPVHLPLVHVAASCCSVHNSVMHTGARLPLRTCLAMVHLGCCARHVAGMPTL